MAKTTVADTIVLVDDEMHHLTWMIDYLNSSGLRVLPVSNANDAVAELDKQVYRATIIDLNIPLLPPMDSAAERLGAVYVKYPGLYVARRARNSGYRDRQVIIYSVHRDPEVLEETKRLACTYILKGRPREIMRELASVLSFDPTS